MSRDFSIHGLTDSWELSIQTIQFCAYEDSLTCVLFQPLFLFVFSFWMASHLPLALSLLMMWIFWGLILFHSFWSDLAAASPLAAPPVSTVCHLSAPTEALPCLKTKEHDVLQRQRVVDLWKDGKSEGSIGQELRMPKSTVHSIIVKYRLSNTVENLPRNGRPKKP